MDSLLRTRKPVGCPDLSEEARRHSGHRDSKKCVGLRVLLASQRN